MRWFKNLKTMTKLMLGFALVGVIMAGVGYVGVSSMGKVNDMLEVLYTRDMAGLSAVKQAEINLFTIGRDMRQSLLVSDKGAREQLAQQIEKTDAILRENLKKYEMSLATAEGKAKYADMEKTYAEYFIFAKDVARLAVAGDDKAARERLAAGQVTVRKVVEGMDSLAVIKENLGKKVYGDSQLLYTTSRNIMLALIVVGVLLGLGLGFFIARLIGRVLGQVVEKAERAASGDLTVRVAVDTEDELGQMGRALDKMLQSFHDAMSEVREASVQTASAAQQLSAGSQQLSSGAAQLAASTEQLSTGSQEQASSLEETAASLEEITGTIKQNADNAQQANQVAVAARGSAEKGGVVVRDAVKAMEAITTSSKKIAEIITTIDEIAFQTNLLALNAAVEAARAGEQGRGFAVVASEVRALAQRSAAASKEIKFLITDSVAKVEDGAKLVHQSGQTLTEIMGGVKKVADLVAEISAASGEQAQGIEQVNTAITQMDTVTQQNAAQSEELNGTTQSIASQAEELNSTAETLAGQADQLAAEVAKFTLSGVATESRSVPLRRESTAKVVPLVARAKAKAQEKPPAVKPTHAAPPHGRRVSTGTNDARGEFEEF